ncbi:PREDICTED: uncharacterized protein LOC105314171 [Amphimedon queenslandica]|uniref:Uncharacterized protein n=1 Tax=Amphimedon queenslandica TaxID=400682 RepID=A0A1X7TYV0_AMPQE|nr:PREDICTED: uncharacterized protein LOC105314171 [Amphimedon queenslandica]|eukprot:XP_011406469.1 PREDICTED: uncharacterized protein LOC105314171 [Amphimedon queenslandica]
MDTTPLVREGSAVARPVNSVKARLFEISGLAASTISLLLALVVNGLSVTNDCTKFGFKNTTSNVSNIFYTQVTPAGWTFAIWSVIYVWQLVWLVYGWTFAFRTSAQKTISPLVYVFYTITNISNIVWIYLWGNLLPQVAFPFIAAMFVALWTSVGIETVYLYNLKPAAGAKSMKADYFLAQLLVVNGLVVYATWLSVAWLINLDIVLSYFSTQTATSAGTISLSVLAFEVLIYFLLENTVLDRYIRYVYMVYPVVLWALSGVAAAHADDANGKRNYIFTLALLGISSVLFLSRIVLLFVFAFFRPLTKSFAVKAI